MAKLLPFLAILFAGMLTALEGATNGLVTKHVGSLYFAMSATFAVSALLLLAAVPFLPFRPDWHEARQLPWYAWLGGAYALITIAIAAWATPSWARDRR